MRLHSIFVVVTLSHGLVIFGQAKIVSGKIINENLETIPDVRIQNSDTTLLATTDKNGEFKIEIPASTKILSFGQVDYEWKSIKLTTNCDTLNIILMFNVTYDYISLAKVDKLRMKRFEKLPELYSMAYKRRIFNSQQPCYTQNFDPIEKTDQKRK